MERTGCCIASSGRVLLSLAALVLTVLLGACQLSQSRVPAQSEAQEQEAPGHPTRPDGEAGGGATGVPRLSVADARGAEGDGVVRVTVSLHPAAAGPVTVSYATEDGSATAGADYQAARGVLTFAAGAAGARQIEVQVRDDAEAEGEESFTVRLLSADGAQIADGEGTVTVADNDGRGVRVEPRVLNVLEGDSAGYLVALRSRPRGTVTVTAAAGSAEVTVEPARLEFRPAGWAEAQTVTVTAGRDEDALAEEPVEVTHEVTGGGYGGTRVPAVQVTIVEADVATLAVAGARGTEQAGRLAFAVTLSAAADREVTAEYETGGGAEDSASEGEDYRSTSGTLRFPAGTTVARTISVEVLDDELDEVEEQFTVTVRNANAPLAGGGATATVLGIIEDDDEEPQLSIEDDSLREGDGSMRFAVSLQPASGQHVSVMYATADDTATAVADYTAVSGSLAFAAGSTEQTVEVPIVDDETAEQPETFTVTLSNATGASVTRATAIGTVTDDDADTPLQLSTLRVTGGGTMYPSFEPDTYHYALTCADATALQVVAEATRSTAQLNLLRANPSANEAAVGALDVQVDVDKNDDIAIELRDGGGSEVRYVVHCVPPEFPDIKILTKSAGVSEGLLLMDLRVEVRPQYVYMVVVDNNGVPRFHRRRLGWNFRLHRDGPTIDGRQVRYSIHVRGAVELLDRDFAVIRSVRSGLAGAAVDHHDFLITGDGNFLFSLRKNTTRDLSAGDNPLNPYTIEEFTDSLIREVTPSGAEELLWNSWDHLRVDPDCRVREFPGQYAHLNSMQVFDGDIVASFRGCAQVLRIDGATGVVKWKLGGSEQLAESNTNTEYLEIEGDAEGEFCGQHHATLRRDSSNKEKVVLFDNGEFCLGPRKADAQSTRVVEYDISSGTHAVWVREYDQPAGQGFADAAGAVTVLSDDRWLIAWGRPGGVTTSPELVSAVSEIDPSNGTSLLEMHMSKGNTLVWTYRVYREPESDIAIPLNLP